MKIRHILIVILIVCGLSLSTIPAYAADYQSILSCKAFHNLLETGDMLVVAHYDIHYDTLPTTSVDKYYHFKIYDTDGITTLAMASPYAYYNSGYDQGVVSWYFSAASAPTWGEPYTISISGNPEYHTAPIPAISYGLLSSDYSSYTTQADNRDALGDYILSIAHSLQSDWGYVMSSTTDVGEILSTTADSYFRSTIPCIAYMAPQIFAIQNSTVDWGTPLHPGTTQADTYASRYAGTWVGDILDNTFLGLQGNMWTGFLIVLLCLVIFVISYRMFGTTIPALIGSYILILMGFLMGFMAPVIFGIVTLAAAIYIGYIIYFRSSSG